MGMGPGMSGLPLQPGGMTNVMTTNSAMTTMTGMPSMRPGIGPTQCRQPPAYKVAAQMARLHRLGRAHSHEGVTTYRTDHEDGTAKKKTKTKTKKETQKKIHVLHYLHILFSHNCTPTHFFSSNF